MNPTFSIPLGAQLDLPVKALPWTTFAQRTLIVAAVAALLFLPWQVAPLFILVFAGILVAVLLRALSNSLAQVTVLSGRWALVIVVAAMLALGGGILYLLGERVAEQLSQLASQLPDPWAQAKSMLQSTFGRDFLGQIGSGDNAMSSLSKIGSVASVTLSAVAIAVLVLFLRLFLVADPARVNRRAAGNPSGRRKDYLLLVIPRLIVLSVLLLAAMPAPAQESLLPTPEPSAGKSGQPAPAPTVEPGVHPEEDAAIAQRLRTTYSVVEGLAPMQVRVTSGVVVLTGEVSSQALKEQAARLARSVKGVAEVENRIEVAQDLKSRLTPALRRLNEAWFGFIRLLPVLLVASAIIAAAVLLGRWLARRRAMYRHLAANEFLARLLAQVVQGVVLIGGAALVMLLLDTKGLVDTVLGAAGILGLALGFALRDTVENYIASILLSLRRPFDPKDYVQIEGHEGFVVRLTSRATVLLTLDGNHVRIPNATVFKGLIVNFTANPQRRFTFRVGIAPNEKLSWAQEVATDALVEVEGVLAEPPPAALYHDVPDVGVTLTVAGWMDQRTHDFLRVRSEAIRVVVRRMTEANVAAPEATIRVRRAPESGTKRQEPKSATATRAPEFRTSRDRSIERVVEQESTRGPDLLDGSKLTE